MPLHPFFADRIDLLSGIPDYRTAFADPALLKRLETYASRPNPWQPPETVRWHDETLVGEHGPFDVRVYRPASDARAALLWVHGGGWASGTLDMPEAHVVAAELASRADAVVVSVGYHLASETLKFPAPLDDVVTAWHWLVSKRDDLGYAGPVALGGASAGASLSLAAAMRLRDAAAVLPSEVLLAYPIVHFPVPALPNDDAAAMAALPPLVRFDAARIAEMQAYYVGRLSNIPVHAVPGHGDLAGLPPIRMITAEYDDLRPSGDLLVCQLQESGVALEHRLALGMLHGHLNNHPGADIPEVSASLDFFAQFARSA